MVGKQSRGIFIEFGRGQVKLTLRRYKFNTYEIASESGVKCGDPTSTASVVMARKSVRSQLESVAQTQKQDSSNYLEAG